MPYPPNGTPRSPFWAYLLLALFIVGLLALGSLL